MTPPQLRPSKNYATPLIKSKSNGLGDRLLSFINPLNEFENLPSPRIVWSELAGVSCHSQSALGLFIHHQRHRIKGK